jgi:hypothetical protein
MVTFMLASLGNVGCEEASNFNAVAFVATGGPPVEP